MARGGAEEMISRPRIVFLGNHTVGVRTMDVLAQAAELTGVVAHPVDPEDGVRYESVFARASQLGVPAVRATGKSEALGRFLADLRPDLLWVTDYRYLLPASILALPRFGVINLHPSLLPKYRGRAPVNWAILRGETRLGLTAHWVDAGMDTGDIIAQRAFELAPQQDVGDALEMLYPLYAAITEEVLSHLIRGDAPRFPQDTAQATVFPRRTPADGRVEWTRPAAEVWNLIRAVTAPYPGAFTPWQGGAVRIWRAAGIRPFNPAEQPEAGEVRPAASPHALLIACADAWLEIEKWEIEGDAPSLFPGAIVGTGAFACGTP